MALDRFLGACVTEIVSVSPGPDYLFYGLKLSFRCVEHCMLIAIDFLFKVETVAP